MGVSWGAPRRRPVRLDPRDRRICQLEAEVAGLLAGLHVAAEERDAALARADAAEVERGALLLERSRLVCELGVRDLEVDAAWAAKLPRSPLERRAAEGLLVPVGGRGGRR